MKIALIQAFYVNVWEPIGLGYIAAAVKKRYPDARIEVYQAFFDTDDYIVSMTKDCDFIGVSCTTPSFEHGVLLARKIKSFNNHVVTVFGGWHVTAVKEAALVDGVDKIVIGEGETAFVSIIEGARDRVIYGIKENIDELDNPTRGLIQNGRTIDLCERMCGLRIASLQANRGCPFSCAFCCERSMTGKFNRGTNPIRTRNSESIINEINDIRHRYHIDRFKFVDATFDVSNSFVEDFCQTKIRMRNVVDWECMIHASLIDPRLFPLMSASGCVQINVGCESGSPNILRDIGKGTTLKNIITVFDEAKKVGIARRAFFILGMPNETMDDIRMTENLADIIGADYIGFTLLCPYPGCDFYSPSIEQDWSKTDEYANDFWKSEHLTNAELKIEQKRLTDKYARIICERQRK